MNDKRDGGYTVLCQVHDVNRFIILYVKLTITFFFLRKILFEKIPEQESSALEILIRHNPGTFYKPGWP